MNLFFKSSESINNKFEVKHNDLSRTIFCNIILSFSFSAHQQLFSFNKIAKVNQRKAMKEK